MLTITVWPWHHFFQEMAELSKELEKYQRAEKEAEAKKNSSSGGLWGFIAGPAPTTIANSWMDTQKMFSMHMLWWFIQGKSIGSAWCANTAATGYTPVYVHAHAMIGAHILIITCHLFCWPANLSWQEASWECCLDEWREPARFC